MRDDRKTKKQLIDELVSLRKRVEDLEASGAECPPDHDPRLGERSALFALVEDSREAFYVSSRDGRLLAWNPAFMELFGSSGDTILDSASSSPPVLARPRQRREGQG